MCEGVCPKDFHLVILHVQYLNNWHPFIHKNKNLGIFWIFYVNSNFGFFAEHQHGMHDFKEIYKIILSKPDKDLKLNAKHSRSYKHGLEK